MEDIEQANNATVQIAPSPAAVATRRIRTFASLSDANFRLYYFANLCFASASNIELMVRSLLVYRITGSTAAIGLMALAGTVPHIFSSLFGGVLADRLHKKHILLGTYIAFGALSLGIAVSLSTGYLTATTWWILIVNSILWNGLIGIRVPAQNAMIPELVGREHLMNAISLSTMAANVVALIMPAAAGFLIDSLGFETIFYLQTAFYVAGLALIIFLPLTGELPVIKESALKNLNNGFKYILREPNLLWILGFTLAGLILANPIKEFMPVFADEILNVGAKGLGLLTSISAFGAIIGSLILASLPNRRRGLLMLGGTVFLGICIAVFSFSKSWPLSLAITLGIGVGTTARQALSQTLAQHNTLKREFQGREMGVYDMLVSFYLAATYVVGVLVKPVGVEWAMGGSAMVLVVICLMALLFVPRLREMD